MARSVYIYLVRYKLKLPGNKTNACGTLLGAFTVKHEAVTWATFKSGHPLEHMSLSAMRDGAYADKTERIIPWE